MLKHKKLVSMLLAVAMLGAMSTSVFAAAEENIVESGEVVISSRARSSFKKYVGAPGRGGNWEHGVLGYFVFSNLSTVDYFNKVSVQTPIDASATTSGWSGYKGGFVSVEKETTFVDGNRAFYDLRDN